MVLFCHAKTRGYMAVGKLNVVDVFVGVVRD